MDDSGEATAKTRTDLASPNVELLPGAGTGVETRGRLLRTAKLMATELKRGIE